MASAPLVGAAFGISIDTRFVDEKNGARLLFLGGRFGKPYWFDIPPPLGVLEYSWLGWTVPCECYYWLIQVLQLNQTGLSLWKIESLILHLHGFEGVWGLERQEWREWRLQVPRKLCSCL